MAKTRIEFQSLLEELLNSRQVYFQPPETVKMSYPAIVYKLSNIDDIFANNSAYDQRRMYEVIVIDRSPESEAAEKILRLPFCSFARSYRSENLNHFVFNIYF